MGLTVASLSESGMYQKQIRNLLLNREAASILNSHLLKCLQTFRQFLLISYVLEGYGVFTSLLRLENKVPSDLFGTNDPSFHSLSPVLFCFLRNEH